jgi:hypothetical protein
VRVFHAQHPGTLIGVPQNDPVPASFAAATGVRRAEGGGIVAELDPGWDVGGSILNGGYLLAVIGRAAVLDSPHPHPVAVSASYLRATGPGPATLAVTSGPAGRTLAHRSVVLSGADGPTLSAQVTTATLGDEPPVYSRPMPEMPPVEECLSARAGDDLGGHPVPEVGLRRLLLFADVLPPTSWSIGLMGWAPTVQLQVLVRALPAPGWCLVEASASEVAGGWLDEDYRIWDSTGRLVAQSRQLARVPRG